jgi:apyrase
MKYYITLIITLFFSATSFASQYIAIIDAGSSGSRLYLYEYEKTKSLPTIKTIYTKSIDIPLSFYKDTPQKAAEGVIPLLNSMMEFLKDHQINPKQVSIDILATAGMRLLPEDTQDAIYLQISNYVTQHYPVQLDDIGTLSPEEEAIFGWLDVNYLLNNFQNHSPTIGSIDIGGASMEIAFEDKTNNRNDTSITIDNQRYTVFSANFLGLGADEARKTMAFESNANTCYPLNYKLNDTMTGNFNQPLCKTLFTDVLKPYALKAKIPSTIGKSFIAYSNVFYLYHDLNIEKNPDQTTLDGQLQIMCTQTIEEINKNYAAINPKYRPFYCANGDYLSVLLYDTLELQGSQLTVTNKIGDETINWTLGAALVDILEN